MKYLFLRNDDDLLQSDQIIDADKQDVADEELTILRFEEGKFQFAEVEVTELEGDDPGDEQEYEYALTWTDCPRKRL